MYFWGISTVYYLQPDLTGATVETLMFLCIKNESAYILTIQHFVADDNPLVIKCVRSIF